MWVAQLVHISKTLQILFFLFWIHVFNTNLYITAESKLKTYLWNCILKCFLVRLPFNSRCRLFKGTLAFLQSSKTVFKQVFMKHKIHGIFQNFVIINGNRSEHSCIHSVEIDMETRIYHVKRRKPFPKQVTNHSPQRYSAADRDLTTRDGWHEGLDTTPRRNIRKFIYFEAITKFWSKFHNGYWWDFFIVSAQEDLKNDGTVFT